jgi:hypothetical protein
MSRAIAFVSRPSQYHSVYIQSPQHIHQPSHNYRKMRIRANFYRVFQHVQSLARLTDVTFLGLQCGKNIVCLPAGRQTHLCSCGDARS